MRPSRNLSSRVKSRVGTAVLDALCSSPLSKHIFYRYDYNFTPAQLAFLCQCLDRTQDAEGSIVEIGCAMGHTTVFLRQHMYVSGIDKPYACIDTFSGFTPADVDYELHVREKSAAFDGFRQNKKRWFLQTLANNGFSETLVIQADINDLDLSQIGPIAFALIDVDLYRPVRTALEKVYSRLVNGGMIVVDDCQPEQPFDGALQAYTEFMEGLNRTPDVILDKLGVFHQLHDG